MREPGANNPTTGGAVVRDEHVERRQVWLDCERLPIFAWVHQPTGATVCRGAVVLCAPFGFEYSHSHRTFVHLADALALAGCVAIRFDYPGTGDSGGDESTPGLVEEWLHSIDVVLDFAEELTGEATPAVVGLRLGATLAGTVASRRRVGAFVAWAPILRGRSFTREAMAMDRISSHDGQSDDFLEMGGFRLSPSTTEAISTLDCLSGPLVPEHVLLVDRIDRPVGSRFSNRVAEVDAHLSVVGQADYQEMMAEPHDTVVPHNTIRQIVDWVRATVPEAAIELRGPAESTLTGRVAMMETGRQGSRVREACVSLGTGDGGCVIGVLTEPQTGPSFDPTVVLLPSAGSVHHTGPNRLYVELARELANVGIASFRMDLRNLGDSRLGLCEDENHPYPETAVEDIQRSLKWVTEECGYRRVALVGLCSGAHTAFHAGLTLKDRCIVDLVLINPLTFDYKPGMSLDTPANYETARHAQYYKLVRRDWRKWLRLVQGKSDVRPLLEFMAKRTGQRVRDGVRYLSHLLGIGTIRELGLNLERIAQLDRPMHFVFSASDPGHEIVRREAPLILRRLRQSGRVSLVSIDDADHTFSRKRPRAIAIAHVVRSLSESATRLSATEVPPGPDL